MPAHKPLLRKFDHSAFERYSGNNRARMAFGTPIPARSAVS